MPGFRQFEYKGYSHFIVVEKYAMSDINVVIKETFSMIGEEDNQRIIEYAEFFEHVEKPFELIVNIGNFTGIRGLEILYIGNIT